MIDRFCQVVEFKEAHVTVSYKLQFCTHDLSKKNIHLSKILIVSLNIIMIAKLPKKFHPYAMQE